MCPPETTKQTKGGSKSLWSIKLALICPSIWLTPINGLSKEYANPLAYWSPTKSAPTNPGPYVTAIASMSSNVTPATSKASSTTAFIASMCFLDATSGTTPPNFVCISIWEDIIFDKTSLPLTTTAAAVSSQLLSIANIIFLSIFIPLNFNFSCKHRVLYFIC